MEEMLLRVVLDAHIDCLKDQQREHKLFLDLEEDKVRKKYFRTFPNGTSYISFLWMICFMTSENNLNNKVVINEMNMTKEKNARVEIINLINV